MPQSLSKDYLVARLGQLVQVNEKERGIIAYEHNTGKPALYSKDDKLLRFLKKDDVVRFQGESIDMILEDIKILRE